MCIGKKATNETVVSSRSMNYDGLLIDINSLLMYNGLNDDALVGILNNLPIEELLRICKNESNSNKFITQFVRDRVFQTKIVNINEIITIQQVEEIFQTFGGSMKKITVSKKSNRKIDSISHKKICVFLCFQVKSHNNIEFNKYLQLLIRFCSPNVLTELELIFPLNVYESDSSLNMKLMKKARPFFQNLIKLKLLCHIDHPICSFLSGFLTREMFTYTDLCDSWNIEAVDAMKCYHNLPHNKSIKFKFDKRFKFSHKLKFYPKS